MKKTICMSLAVLCLAYSWTGAYAGTMPQETTDKELNSKVP